MGKKRDAKSQSKRNKSVTSPTISKWNKREDIEFDEEDAFHEGRDRVLLDGGEDQDSEGDLQNEVFALKGISSDQLDTDEEVTDDDNEQAPQPTKSHSKQKPKGKSTVKTVDEPPETSSESEDQGESWGRKKSAYYSTNAAAIDSDDEETQRLEEIEVRRLQTKAREQLDEEDFGLTDAPRMTLLDEEPSLSQEDSRITSQDPAVLIQHLEKTSPETLALAQDWEDIIQELAKSQEAISFHEVRHVSDPLGGKLHLYHQTLLTYTTTLAFYIYMRVSPKYLNNPRLLQSHPILSRLVTLRQSLAIMKDFNFFPEDSDGDSEEDEWGTDWDMNGLTPLDLEEIEQLLKDAKLESSGESSSPKKKKKKKEKLPNSNKSKKNAFDLPEPLFISSKSKSKPKPKTQPQSTSQEAFGEYTALDAVDAADKSARKKSLQFHTSRIESVASKRSKARAAIGGDEDIPYREREKEREMRLQRENRAKIGKLGQGGEALEEEVAKSGVKRPREVDEDVEMGDDGYYDLVEKQTRELKKQKKESYEAQKLAERMEREGDDEEAEGGPRSLTRAILKNKGLTPSRSKSVRNPRLKKRIKFDEAKKKIRSQKAVFQGGLAASGGRYDGESSGISSRVVKSVKLG